MYILQEIQTNDTTTSLVPATTYSDKNKAEAAYHTALAAAAVSKVPVHTVVLFDEHGTVVKRDFYEHIPKEGE